MRIFFTILGLLFFIAPAYAEPVPGDSCATYTAGNFMQSGGPELGGAVHFMNCEAGIWKVTTFNPIAKTATLTSSNPIISSACGALPSSGTATLTNTSTVAITVTPPSAASMSGNTRLRFVSTTCGAALAASAACNVVVQLIVGNDDVDANSISPSGGQTFWNFNGTLSVTTEAGLKTVPLNASCSRVTD